MRRATIICLAAALAICVAAVGAPGSLAKATKPKVAKLCGYYFTPTTVKMTFAVHIAKNGDTIRRSPRSSPTIKPM